MNPDERLDLSREDVLNTIAFIHDREGPRSAYSWSLGRSRDPNTYRFHTADLDTQRVEDFIIAFYTRFNATFGQTY